MEHRKRGGRTTRKRCAEALALQAKLQDIAERIDESSGSPVFTAEEHDEIQTLLGVTV